AYLYIGKLPPDKPQASAPVGKLDRAAGLEGARVRVQRWTFDPDGPRFTVKVEAWIDGKPGEKGARRVALGPASRVRADVARAHEGSGADHGFDVTIDGVPAGTHSVRVYGLN